jgi:predicted DNA-binding transcriptional regulator YafY
LELTDEAREGGIQLYNLFMVSERIFSILIRMDQLISHRNTGGPSHFAELLGISERTLYNYLRILKELGGDIHFNSCYCSYEYLNGYRLFIGYHED